MFPTSAHITLSLALLTTLVSADPTTLAAPGQPTQSGTPLSFKLLGTSGVSAQQLFLGTENTVSQFIIYYNTRRLLLEKGRAI